MAKSSPTSSTAPAGEHLSLGAAFNLFVIGLTAFLTVVDLFATQAILPALTQRYDVSPAAMATAVNASTAGMAIAGLAVAWFSSKIDRRIGVTLALAVLAIPTALLAHAPDLGTFAALRVAQGALMAAAFTLTLAHLGERCTAAASALAFAAYITGNVASNLVGRLIAAETVNAAGLDANFYLFSGLNLAGAALVWATLSRAPRLPGHETHEVSPLETFRIHLANRELRIAFAIGFCILFAFIGTFTYVNYVLVRPPLALGMASLGLVYFVFAPAIATTPLAGALGRRLGARRALWLGLAIAGLGLPLLLAPSLPPVLLGMVLVAVGTFFAQATATGFVSRAATADRGAASGLYLASYFAGGLVGTALLGVLFGMGGWPATVGGIAAVLVVAAVLASLLRTPAPAASTS